MATKAATTAPAIVEIGADMTEAALKGALTNLAAQGNAFFRMFQDFADKIGAHSVADWTALLVGKLGPAPVLAADGSNQAQVDEYNRRVAAAATLAAQAVALTQHLGAGLQPLLGDATLMAILHDARSF
jgi:hypothetical protein